MTSQEWEAKFAELGKYGRIKTMPWASLEDISRFEEMHGIRLPQQYREWLQYTDGGILFPPAGVQLYGVAHKPLLSFSKEECPDSMYVAAGAMPYGDPVLFEKKSGRFMIFNREAQSFDPKETFPDFVAFLDQLPALLGLED